MNSEINTGQGLGIGTDRRDRNIPEGYDEYTG